MGTDAKRFLPPWRLIDLECWPAARLSAAATAQHPVQCNAVRGEAKIQTRHLQEKEREGLRYYERSEECLLFPLVLLEMVE